VSEYDKGFVNSLVLLSPGGLPRQPQISKEELVKKEDQKDAIDDTKEILWGNNFSPLILVRASGKFLASQIIRAHMKKTTAISDEKEIDAYVEFQK